MNVIIERMPDGRHKASVDGEVIALLSPYHRGGYGKRITSWRIIDAATKRVDTSDLSPHPGYEANRIEKLQAAAIRLWNNRQPEVIEAAKLRAREDRLSRARNLVLRYEGLLSEARAALAQLEQEVARS